MESLVLPEINSEFDRERARDEMPQSAAGRTVMTTEPKFVPDEAVSVMLGGSAEAKSQTDRLRRIYRSGGARTY